jgi:hypothetical protein
MKVQGKKRRKKRKKEKREPCPQKSRNRERIMQNGVTTNQW